MNVHQLKSVTHPLFQGHISHTLQYIYYNFKFNVSTKIRKITITVMENRIKVLTLLSVKIRKCHLLKFVRFLCTHVLGKYNNIVL